MKIQKRDFVPAKLILSTAILMAAFGIAAFGQENRTPVCPTLSVTAGKAETVGEAISFTAEVKGFDLKNLTYQWSIDNGTITAGQGTPVIEVDTTGNQSAQVTAAVEIKGLPENCPNSASGTGSALRNCDPMIFDEYKKISLREERAKLAAVARELEENKTWTAYFIIYGKSAPRFLPARTREISKYLTETRKIPKERFQIAYGGFHGNFRVLIYLAAPCN